MTNEHGKKGMIYPNLLSGAIHLPADIWQVSKDLIIQKRFLEKYIKPITKSYLHVKDGTIDEADIYKIFHYYGLAVPAILGEAFCSLRGEKMSLSERWTITSQGTMTGLFDDFFDKDYMDDNEIESVIEGKIHEKVKSAKMNLFDDFYQKALSTAPDARNLKQSLLEVYYAQVESKKQLDHNLSEERILEITIQKGGSSLLFYRTAFSPKAGPRETQLLHQLGGLMQLCNDIFDVYKDRESGIRTMITETKHIALIRSYLKKELQAVHEKFSNSWPGGFKAFMNSLSIGIFSRSMVCLDQLEKNELLTGGEFKVHEYNRQQLICDMDKPVNLLRSALNHLRS